MCSMLPKDPSRITELTIKTGMGQDEILMGCSRIGHNRIRQTDSYTAPCLCVGSDRVVGGMFKTTYCQGKINKKNINN